MEGRSAEERLARLIRLQALLADVAHNLGPATELPAVLTTVLGAMRSLVRFRGGSVCLVSDGEIRIAAADPVPSPDMLNARLPVGAGLAGRVVATGKAVYSADLDADDRADRRLHGLGSNASMRSYLAVPLVCLGQVIGLLEVDSAEPDAFDEDDIVVLEGLATQVGGAIESARRYEEAQELERLKADFLARVSHELRTPLTIISGFATTLIAHNQRLGDDQRLEMLGRIDAAADRLEMLLDELLTVTGFEAGVVTPNPADVTVAEVLDTVVGDFVNGLSHPVDASRLSVECPPALVLRTDARLLRHAVRLLVDNALKYGDAVVVRATGGDGGAATIDVVDDGPGVPADMRERIFERFTRGPDDTKPGMGLGLPLVRLLASGLGARIAVGDNPGGAGAVFRLQFPPAPAPSRAAR